MYVCMSLCLFVGFSLYEYEYIGCQFRYFLSHEFLLFLLILLDLVLPVDFVDLFEAQLFKHGARSNISIHDSGRYFQIVFGQELCHQSHSQRTKAFALVGVLDL